MPTTLSLLIALTLLTAPAVGATAPRGIDDLCTPPKSMPSRSYEVAAAGVTFRIPKGFLVDGGFTSSSDARSYSLGRQGIGITWGRLPLMLQGLDIRKLCRTLINGRPVTITEFRSGMRNIGIAEFPAIAGSHATSIWIDALGRDVLMQYRWVFWTVTFPAGQALAAGPSATPSTEPTSPAPPQHAGCARLIAPSDLPPLDAIVDTGIVQMLARSAGPLPAGHAVVALQYDSTGSLAGVAVDESDLPEASQRQIASLVSSNVRPHPAGAPLTLRVRVDSDSTGLRYGVAPGCAVGRN